MSRNAASPAGVRSGGQSYPSGALPSATENGSPFDLAYASRASNMEAIDFWRAVYSFE